MTSPEESRVPPAEPLTLEEARLELVLATRGAATCSTRPDGGPCGTCVAHLVRQAHYLVDNDFLTGRALPWRKSFANPRSLRSSLLTAWNAIAEFLSRSER